ncbi:MAG: histidine kinase [Lewinellaceae bacterium]|nr:histidine kinase [Saprospiraceae bacterium]MCB9330025.1 histidine kinase [Lewinellaceae bacterium]
MSTIQPVQPADLAQMRLLCEGLAQWAYTDFDQARTAVQELEKRITAQTPFDIRLAYHRHRAFLENQWRHFDQSLEHFSQAIAILDSLAEPLPLAECWLDVAAVQLNRRDWPAAQQCLDRARRFLGTFDAPHLHALLTCREGFLHLHLGNHRLALDNLQESERVLLSLGEQASLKDFYILTLVISGLGDLYERLDEKNNSLDAYLRVLPLVERHQLRPRLPWHYLNAGRAALAQNDAEHARECFENVLEFAEEEEPEAKAHALANLGILALLQNENQRAVELFDEATAQFPNPSKPTDFTNLSKIQSWRAELLWQLEDLEEAEKYFGQAFVNGQEGHDLNHLAQICQALAHLCEARSDFQSACQWQRRATELTERHYNQVRDRERQEIEARHDLERSRQEAQMAKLRVASLQLRALRAQMNPHFLFNALNAIQGLITSGRNDEAETYLARFAKLMRHTLEYSDLEEVTLEQEVEFLNRYLDLNRKLRFRERLQYEVLLPQGADAGDLLIPTMIVQPFVENAIEHGLRPRQEGKLRIEFQLSEDERMLLCIIEDDGVGYNKGKEKQSAQPAFQSHRSRGMEITRERLNLLHKLRKNQGTQFVKITDLGDKTNGARSGTQVEVLLPVLQA